MTQEMRGPGRMEQRIDEETRKRPESRTGGEGNTGPRDDFASLWDRIVDGEDKNLDPDIERAPQHVFRQLGRSCSIELIPRVVGCDPRDPLDGCRRGSGQDERDIGVTRSFGEDFVCVATVDAARPDGRNPKTTGVSAAEELDTGVLTGVAARRRRAARNWY